MNNELKHIGVLGMKWGHRKSNSTGPSTKTGKKKETNLERLKREANPKPWSTAKKIVVGSALAVPALVLPIPLAIGYGVALGVYARQRADTQKRAQAALAEIGKKKIKSLSKPKIVDLGNQGKEE